MQLKHTAIAVALANALALNAHASEQTQKDGDKATPLTPVVVTAPRQSAPLSVTLDPREAQQPLPANDGADVLKTVPGMSVIRKGGTDGDPVFRGMAASRLNILLDGEVILGGCGMRMDPPTAYVFPDTYDQVTVLKGPYSVQYGPGASAATVMFERAPRSFAQPGWEVHGSVVAGSFGRHDEMLDVSAGMPTFQAGLISTSAAQDDYQDGNGNDVHARYRRWSNTALLAWTPDADTRIELSAVRSDGEAAYADRSMDGARFKRENVGLKFEKRHLSPLVRAIEAQLYYNDVNHVMDNYSLRSNSGMRMVSNPTRETTGGRFSLTLLPAETTEVIAGVDFQRNQHSLRSSMNNTLMPYGALPYKDDARFSQWGLFAEAIHHLAENQRLLAGLRSDHWEARDQRGSMLMLKSGTATDTLMNPSAGTSRDSRLTSGYLRYENDVSRSTTLFAGIGHTERFPDYWELLSANKESSDSNSAFGTRPEKTTQIDLGASHDNGPLQANIATFYNHIDDFILIENGVLKSGRTIASLLTRNVDAVTWGAEGNLRYLFSTRLESDLAIAWVRGENRTDDRPLGQIPPLEARLGLRWLGDNWSVGGLMRAVASQHRVAEGQGNIVGQDIGSTAGFTVFSLNGSWQPRRGITLQAGVDNLFDRAYAEHISRSGSSVVLADYPASYKVNEPGRSLWVKASFNFN